MVTTYKKVGVDITEIKKTQNVIGRIISTTYNSQKLAKVEHGFGHYAGIVQIPGKKFLATHTDGVGSKIIIANMLKKYDTIGIDCIAMNVNDIICVGATPISFVDYIAANKNDQRVFKQIVKGLAYGAKLAQVPIIGGETAIMPDLFSGNKFTMDLAGTVVGITSKRKMVFGKSIKSGDVIIGIKSSGLHSNGYTLARNVLFPKYKLNDKIKGIGHLGRSLLKPTEIYVKPVLDALTKCKIHGLAHITGGSFTKLLRLKNIGYDLDNLPKPPPLMQLIEDCGVENREMYKTFNMGIGFCIVSPKNNVTKIQNIFKKHGFTSYEIGKIISKKGVFINSRKIA